MPSYGGALRITHLHFTLVPLSSSSDTNDHLEGLRLVQSAGQYHLQYGVPEEHRPKTVAFAVSLSKRGAEGNDSLTVRMLPWVLMEVHLKAVNAALFGLR